MSKSQLLAVCKESILNIDTACLKEKDREKTHNANSNYKGTKEIISISDSEDFRIRNITKDKREICHGNNEVNPSRRHNNPHLFVPVFLSFKIHESNISSYQIRFLN